jgi:hypothetical protein
MPSKTAAYHTLLGLVYDELPEDTVARCLAAKVHKNNVTLQNVRRGTTHKLNLLMEMVRVWVPSFEIPADVQAAI